MDKKKALLVVAGGRLAPDVLPLLYLQPDLVLTVTSEEGWEGEKAFLDIANALPSCQVEPPPGVNAYDLNVGMNACRELCKPYSDAEWTFTITSAPKILAIAAYEVAKEMGVPCWYIDSQGDRIVSLVKKMEMEVDKQRFFHLSFDEYVKIQGRRCKRKEGPTKDYRSAAEGWDDISQKIALSPDTHLLTPILYRHKKQGEINEVITKPIPLADLATLPLVRFLLDKGLLTSTDPSTEQREYYFASVNAAQFLGTGDWLEVYVRHQTNQAKFADDVRWGYSIIRKRVNLELDLAVMYKAQLVIAECKTNENPFRGQYNYLRDIDAVADLLGRTYVSKIFITNQPAEGESYKVFSQHAKDRNIIVVTKEELSKVGDIVKQAAMHPKYPRK